MFLFDNPIICIIFVCFVMSLPTICMIYKVNQLQNIVDDQNNQIMVLIRKINNLKDESFEMYLNEQTNSENLNSLSSGVRYMLQEQQRSLDNKIYPTPQLSEMIGVTIKEQIATEEMLSHNMRIPNPQSTTKIIENVIKTYPHVDTEYLTKRCMAQIEADIQKARAGE